MKILLFIIEKQDRVWYDTSEVSIMKLMMIVVSDEYQEAILSKLNEQGHRATLISSTGDFLNYGKSTLLLGVQEQYVDEVISYIQMQTKSFYEDETSNEDMPTQVYIMDTNVATTSVQQEK